VQISADGRWVVYGIAHKESTSAELYSVPIEGGTPIKLTDPQAPTQQGVVFSGPNPWPDANSRFLMRNADAPGALLGVCRTPNTQASTSERSIVYPIISAGTTFGLCVSNQQAPQVYTLFQIPLDGGAPTKLNGTLGPDQVVDTFLFSITPDSKRVIYVAAPSSGGIAELYSVPAADQER
jgi:hypothetical protein